MAIQVVREGKFKQREWKGECYECHGVFKWEDSDCLQIIDSQRDGPCSVINCPTLECPGSVNGYPVKL